MTMLIKNIGEFFTGDLARPTAPVKSILIDGRQDRRHRPAGRQAKADKVLDAAGGAVMPGLVDGHVHPVFGEWTPAQDAIGWIGNYLHGGTTSMISAGELHIPGIDYDNLTPELVTSLAVVTAATTGRVRWSGVKLYAGTVLAGAGNDRSAFRSSGGRRRQMGEVSVLSVQGRHHGSAQLRDNGAGRAACASRFTPAACRAPARASCAATTSSLGCNRTSPPMSAAGRSR